MAPLPLNLYSCLKIGPHDPFFGSNYFSGFVSTHRNADFASLVSRNISDNWGSETALNDL